VHKKDSSGAIMMFTSDRAKSVSIERRFAAQQIFCFFLGPVGAHQVKICCKRKQGAFQLERTFSHVGRTKTKRRILLTIRKRQVEILNSLRALLESN